MTQFQINLQKKAIISHLLGFDQRLMTHLFDPCLPHVLRENPAVILEDSWELPLEEQMLVRAALDIWSDSGNVFLWELLKLSPQNLSRLLVALNNCIDLGKLIPSRRSSQHG